jgi:phosphonoacetaldehyde hydrolase
LSANPLNICLIVFDWAGTTVDHGCYGPLAAFVRVFARYGVEISPAEARGPMGLHKKDHLREMLRAPEITERWRRAHGRDWAERDVKALYQDFIPLQLEVIDEHSRVVPGLLDCVAELRRQGIRIGATTGYFQAAAERVYAAARVQGYVPDHVVCAEDVPDGRPAPWMVFRIMERLSVYPPAAVVKVGDTVPDIEEGLNAGAWSVGVTRASSEVGCTEEEWAALGPTAERQKRLAPARQKLLAAGAHVVLESLAELPALVTDLSDRLHRGEKP